MTLWLVLLGTAAVQSWVLRRLRFDWFVTAIALGGTAVCSIYLSYTSITERNYDAEAQLEYIQAIVERQRLPDVFACGVCGHPPLYYLLAALWSKTVLFGGWLPLERGLQWLSLWMWLGFVVFALLIVRRSIVNPTAARVAAALIVFWPSGIINSVRVHNDALAAPLMLASIYFLAEWDRRGRERCFQAALLMAALALLTKASGYTVAATLLLACLLRLRRASLRRQSIQRFLAASFVLGATGLLAVSLRESRNETTTCRKVLGHACDGRYVPPIPDSPKRFLSFDVHGFVLRMDALTPDPERDYFLNRFAKSSLFGVQPLGGELKTKPHERLAALISVLLLALASIAAIGLPLMRAPGWRRYRVYFVSAAVMLVFLVAFRLRAPNQYHEDFRHIYPALVPFCLGYIEAVTRLGRFSWWLRGAGFAVALSMAALAAAFFVLPWT